MMSSRSDIDAVELEIDEILYYLDDKKTNKLLAVGDVVFLQSTRPSLRQRLEDIKRMLRDITFDY